MRWIKAAQRQRHRPTRLDCKHHRPSTDGACASLVLRSPRISRTCSRDGLRVCPPTTNPSNFWVGATTSVEARCGAAVGVQTSAQASHRWWVFGFSGTRGLRPRYGARGPKGHSTRPRLREALARALFCVPCTRPTARLPGQERRAPLARDDF